MTDVEIPTYQDLMYPTLVAIEKLGGSGAVSELEEAVPEVAGLTEHQMAVEFPSDSPLAGTPKVVNRLGWSRSYLKKIGALDNSTRGVWSITSKGYEYLHLQPADAEEALRRAEKEARAEMHRAKAAEAEDAEEGDEAESDWRDALLTTLKSMDPTAFERLSMRLLREAGFRNVEVLGKSGDGGIDGVGVYKVSLVSFPTYFQCKRFSGSVSSSVIRDFRGAMSGRGDKGLVITTGTFTPSAKAEATRDGAPPVDLIGGDDLCELLKEYELGVNVETRTIEEVTFDPDFFDSI